ncbi:DgyrCDS10349 [Dimorphilus gyrociliatus]|uniref:DgyrCDS10349 n=1 Tax=Dimorphilus gyrociliatus TaxID=2664684 RepID=A0A7I8VZX4_9ANNE|nr:DgyrCDS10349 [Dimorphilus gyrociliatus]
MSGTLMFLLSIDFGLQAVGCIFSILLKTEKLFDLCGAITNFLLVYISLQENEEPSLRQNILSFMAMLWALRLGLFLFFRVLKSEDRRFKHAKQNPKRMAVFWTIQGIWCFVTLLPTILLNLKENDELRPITGSDIAGFVMFIFGFVFESLADYQKTVFRNDPRNKNKFINVGLWSVIRHPNYLGEIVIWCGAYVCASTSFRGLEGISVLSPILVAILLTKVSGIPLLEKQGWKKWGTNSDYIAYMKNTKRLVPRLW